MANNVRRPLFDGMREVHAIWFDRSLIGEAEARRRVLGHWRAGARLHETATGYLLTLAAPMVTHCASLDGLAFCRTAGTLASGPLSAGEIPVPSQADCWLVRGAQAQGLMLSDAGRVDPSAWIDVSAIALCVPLKVPVSLVRTVLGEPEAVRPLREILGDAVGPPSERQREMLSALRGAPAGNHRSAISAAVKAAAAAAAAGGVGVAGILGGLVGSLLRRGVGGSAGEGAMPEGEEPAWKRRMMEAAAELAAMTRISRAIGWRQAAYLRKMVDMFERGDIGEALRHAIPLDGKGLSERQALGAPQARSSLDIRGPGGTSAVIGLNGDVADYLRKSYRRMFERLDREGRVDEATFVLAELLNAGAEAVDYLERKERLKQAAQLAETLQLDPQMAVRLWIMAGDAERAIRLARLHGEFATAVLQLERKQRPEAEPLRMMWAEYLVDRGDLIEAAEVIWPLQQYRSLALEWLLKAEQSGRTLGARALVRKLSLVPELLEASVPAFAALLDRDDEEGPYLRASLAGELVALQAHSQATRRLAAEVLRHVLADRSLGAGEASVPLISKLAALAAVGMLKSDMPPLKLKDTADPAGGYQAADGVIVVDARQQGVMQIHDARALPGGHYLLALGESGVVRINAHGKRLAHFPLPAQHLVLSPNGERALALAQRGEVMRITRIDLTKGRMSDWMSQRLDWWAPQFDGVVWNAVIDNRVVAIDTSKDQLSVIWQVADLPGPVIAFNDSGVVQTIVMGGADHLHQWRYGLPSRRLMERDVLPLPPAQYQHIAPRTAGPAPVYIRVSHEMQAQVHLLRPEGSQLLLPLEGEGKVLRIDTDTAWATLHAHGPDGGSISYVLDKRLEKLAAKVSFQGGQHVRSYSLEDRVLLFDRRGRLVDIDFSSRRVRMQALG